MADEMTADDLRHLLNEGGYKPEEGALNDNEEALTARVRAFAGRMDEGQRLASPGTVTELDLIVFLEWLDSTRQVTEWGDPGATHEDTAREYLAQAPPSGNVTVSADDLTIWLEESAPGPLHHRPGETCEACGAWNNLRAALRGARRG